MVWETRRWAPGGDDFLHFERNDAPGGPCDALWTSSGHDGFYVLIDVSSGGSISPRGRRCRDWGARAADQLRAEVLAEA